MKFEIEITEKSKKQKTFEINFPFYCSYTSLEWPFYFFEQIKITEDGHSTKVRKEEEADKEVFEYLIESKFLEPDDWQYYLNVGPSVRIYDTSTEDRFMEALQEAKSFIFKDDQ